MNTLKRLDNLLLKGRITIEEYESMRKRYEDTLFRLYVRDIISEAELKERLGKF